MKNTLPFFSISLAFMKPEISATFFSDKAEFFFMISPRYYSSEFSQVISHFSQKSQNKKFLEFFQLFAAFIKTEKCRLFFAFLRLAYLIGSCQERERNSNQYCCSFNVVRWLPRVITNIFLIERELENET